AGWRGALLRFGERIFGHSRANANRNANAPRDSGLKLLKLRNAESERHAREMEKLGRAGGPSSLPSYYDYEHQFGPVPAQRTERWSAQSGSMYSQVTGMPRRAAEPRMPVKNVEPMPSRFSWTTSGSSVHRSPPPPPPPPPPPVPQTEAQKYAMSVSTPDGVGGMQRGMYWLEPMSTGSTGANSGSKNPFRK
ncbi:hypothetical protein EVG20_g8864, partial [Dentipellis fragilis]